MFVIEFLFETSNTNLLLGFMPEPIGLLIFGVVMIAFAVSLRRFFNRGEEKQNFEQRFGSINQKEKAAAGK